MTNEAWILVILTLAVVTDGVLVWWFVRHDTARRIRLQSAIERSRIAHRIHELAVKAADEINESAGLSEYEYDETVGIIAANVRAALQGEQVE